MTYVREVTEADFYYSMCLFFHFDSICVFFSLFEVVSLISKQFNAFNACILLLHVFSKRVTLTRMRVGVTHFTHYRLLTSLVLNSRISTDGEIFN